MVMVMPRVILWVRIHPVLTAIQQGQQILLAIQPRITMVYALLLGVLPAMTVIA